MHESYHCHSPLMFSSKAYFTGNVFYLQSGLEPERQSLRIKAIFTGSNDESQQVPFLGVYSSINDLIRGFDRRTLQAAFKVVKYSEMFENKAILLIHFSARYYVEEINDAVSKMPAAFTGRVFALTEGI
ncbi:hypothetical protein Droror1_Dr00013700 [Drosera rotundifolia]